MNDNQRAYMNRAKSVEDILKDEEYEAAIEAVVEVDGLHEQIAAKRTEINANDAKATADTRGTTTAKNLEAAEVIETSLKLCHYLQNHALDTNDLELKALIDHQRSELQKIDDNKKLQAAQALVDMAEAPQGDDPPIIEALYIRTPQAYLPAEFTAHKTNVAEFGVLVGKPKAKRAVKTAYTKAVARGITELNAILDTVRTRMGMLQFYEKIIFDAYEAADKIDDAPTHSDDHFVGTIDPNGQKRIDDIEYAALNELRIENTGVTALQITFRTEDGEVIGEPTEITSGATLNLTYEQIADSGHFVWLLNLSPTQSGSYILDLF